MEDIEKDWREDDIADIMPVRIEKKTDTTLGKKFKLPVGEVTKPQYNIFDYFGVSDISRLDKITLGRLYQINERLGKETINKAKQKMILESLEKRLPKTNDKETRIDHIFLWLKRQGRDRIITDFIDKDFYEEQAKETGNWEQFLRLAK